LFAKKRLAAHSLASLFNGVRRREASFARGKVDGEFSAYRIRLTGEISLDIPDSSANLSKYRATLGHKACHSFEPNCDFAQFWHPRFGLIMSIVTKR